MCRVERHSSRSTGDCLIRNCGSIAWPIIKSLQSGLGLRTVDPSAHWPVTHSGYLAPCVICNAPKNDGGFARFETADGCGVLRAEASEQFGEHPYVWCWTGEAELR